MLGLETWVDEATSIQGEYTAQTFQFLKGGQDKLTEAIAIERKLNGSQSKTIDGLTEQIASAEKTIATLTRQLDEQRAKLAEIDGLVTEIAELRSIAAQLEAGQDDAKTRVQQHQLKIDELESRVVAE